LRSSPRYTLDDLYSLDCAVISLRMAADVLGCDPRLVAKGIRRGEFQTITLGARPMILRLPFIERVSGARV